MIDCSCRHIMLSVSLAIAILLLIKGTEVSCSLSNIYRSMSFQNAVFYLIAHDKKMTEPSLWEGTLGSDDDCLSKCLLEYKCKSISTTDRADQGITCHLHAVDRSNHELVVANGFRYYDAGYFQRKIGPICRDESNPCNGSVCVDKDRSFKCIDYPGKSCKAIREQFLHISLFSGYYDVTFGGEKYSVYCDMETLGGGWQLIGKVDVDDKSNANNILRSSIQDILAPKNKNFIPSKKVLKELKNQFGYSQLRFYCHKALSGKIIHIVTRNNSAGKNVLRYYSGEIPSTPQACGSYKMLEDDNSYLSRDCKNWRCQNSWYVPSLDAHPMYIPGVAHFGFQMPRTECDDYVKHLNYNHKGIWRLFAR